ncbi:hypothetical protein F5878DRAFT_613134 [Lentinula raphanica]|uniref:Uncharacterized protein n=1 Tax=Lentinula raphanica TaxID=153919 RepID=A0AA38UJ79_9AGAR|nr:hypothetical protein C8R42DRAFT_669024 [Lentinula raphanica]KAJ3840422.1 hypothetical protein F5878DRAFT_613134 [Lentinula raphanica]
MLPVTSLVINVATTMSGVGQTLACTSILPRYEDPFPLFLRRLSRIRLIGPLVLSLRLIVPFRLLRHRRFLHVLRGFHGRLSFSAVREPRITQERFGRSRSRELLQSSWMQNLSSQQSDDILTVTRLCRRRDG